MFLRAIVIGVLTIWFYAISVAGEIRYDGYWNMTLLNTAANADYLSEDEKLVIAEINKLRSSPVLYAREYLEPLLTLYEGKKLFIPGDVPIMTKEGVNALKDALLFLQKCKPVPLLVPDLRLSRAARDHKTDQAKTGKTGHEGSDRSSAQSRIRRYGDWDKAMGENIFYGESDARAVVLHLVIDDGTLSRGHRKNLLDKDYRLVGVAAGNHPTWRNICVITFADAFK
jgi:hypothetical protein